LLNYSISSDTSQGTDPVPIKGVKYSLWQHNRELLSEAEPFLQELPGFSEPGNIFPSAM
jgi:hypothetical protein